MSQSSYIAIVYFEPCLIVYEKFIENTLNALNTLILIWVTQTHIHLKALRMLAGLRSLRGQCKIVDEQNLRKFQCQN